MPIVLFALTLLFILDRVRRVLEPECPNCAAKHWTNHSTQLNCASCGWSNASAPVIAQPEPSQYELCLN